MDSSARFKAARTLVGSFMILTTFGSLYSWGNITTYVTSYFKIHLSPDITYDDTIWIMSAGVFGLPVLSSLSGYITILIGLKPTLLISCFIMSACQFGLYYMINISTFGFAALFCLSYAFAGIGYMVALLCSIRWLPKHKGLVSGLIVGGFGFSNVYTIPIQTAFINPNNLSPNTLGYFDQDEILEKVPASYILQSAVFLGIQVIGILLISDARKYFESLKKTEDERLFTSADPSKYTEEKEEVPENKEKIFGLSPSQVLRTRKFYIFWSAMFFNCLVSYYMSSMYKAFGQTFISNDHFLALVGSVSSAFNFLGRIVWGQLLDIFQYKKCLILISSALVFMLSTFIFTPYGGKIMFAVWVWAMIFIYGGMYVISPGGVTREFGERFGESNYGMVFSSQVVAAPVVAILVQFTATSLGWAGSFVIFAAASFIGLCISLFFNEHSITIGAG